MFIGQTQLALGVDVRDAVDGDLEFETIGFAKNIGKSECRNGWEGRRFAP
jgi:hypothetical protein